MKHQAPLAFALMAAAVFAALPARAAEEPSCLETANTNPEFAQCTNAMKVAADQRLNQAWDKLFKFVGGSKSERGRLLLAEQRAWLAFRTKACTEYFLPTAGREEIVIHGPLCVTTILENRAADLENRYSLLNP